MSDHTTRQSSNEIPYGYCRCGCGQKTRLAPRNLDKLGWVKDQPLRFIRGHNKRDYASLANTFWARCAHCAPDECWLWTGGKDRRGYGKFVYEGKRYIASRLGYELHYGPISDDLWVLHRCDNPSCCNPHHLFLGTHSDNMTDMKAKGRQPRGEQKNNAKLSAGEVHEIRRLHEEGMSLTEIARQFGIVFQNVSCIVNRKSWKHIP